MNILKFWLWKYFLRKFCRVWNTSVYISQFSNLKRVSYTGAMTSFTLILCSLLYHEISSFGMIRVHMEQQKWSRTKSVFMGLVITRSKGYFEILLIKRVISINKSSSLLVSYSLLREPKTEVIVS